MHGETVKFDEKVGIYLWFTRATVPLFYLATIGLHLLSARLLPYHSSLHRPAAHNRVAAGSDKTHLPDKIMILLSSRVIEQFGVTASRWLQGQRSTLCTLTNLVQKHSFQQSTQKQSSRDASPFIRDGVL